MPPPFMPYSKNSTVSRSSNLNQVKANFCKVSGHGIQPVQINRIGVGQLSEMQRLVERSETSL